MTKLKIFNEPEVKSSRKEMLASSSPSPQIIKLPIFNEPLLISENKFSYFLPVMGVIGVLILTGEFLLYYFYSPRSYFSYFFVAALIGAAVLILWAVLSEGVESLSEGAERKIQ